MYIHLSLGERTVQADLRQPLEISIRLDFKGTQPNHFGVSKAGSEPLQLDGFTGDVNQGSGCNVDEIRLIPHCNGTHTECAGHITATELSIDTVLRENIFLAALISVQPVRFGESGDSYLPAAEEDDCVINRAEIVAALSPEHLQHCRGLIIRTLPNREEKKSRDYLRNPPAFFTVETMEWIAAQPIDHLLVDLPSLDRMYDQGRLTAHHRFWNIPDGEYLPDERTRSERTVTEMIYVPDQIADGVYLCQIQIPPFRSDAAPSRVFLYQLQEQK